MSQRVEENWPPAMVALNRQCDYYISEIERITAERDEWKAKFERLAAAGEAYFQEVRAENERLRQLIKDMIEWNHLYGYPREAEWVALEERALAALGQPPQEDV